ncbi:MAG TPA: hypothetical protein VK698_01220, partial [Kofleriaceae bacterium]|nr:hypothetical protein [Kofleriaceae bacterium]
MHRSNGFHACRTILALAVAATASACDVGDDDREVMEEVPASEVSRQDLGVERWLIYTESDGYGVRVVGVDDSGSSRGELVFGLTYASDTEYRVNARFGDGELVVHSSDQIEVESNTLISPEAGKWMNAAHADLQSTSLRAGGCGKAVVTAGATCAGAYAACDDSILACGAGGILCGVSLWDAGSECFFGEGETGTGSGSGSGTGKPEDQPPRPEEPKQPSDDNGDNDGDQMDSPDDEGDDEGDTDEGDTDEGDTDDGDTDDGDTDDGDT